MVVRAQRPVLVTGPAADLLSIDEVKAHLRVDHPDEDRLIASLMAVAVGCLDGIDGILGRALVTQTWRARYSGFPETREIRLPLAPVQSVTSVTYLDQSGAAQTLSAAAYALRDDDRGSYLAIDPDATVPATAHNDHAVTVTFVAGYGNAPSDVPEPIRVAALMHISALYARRDGVGAEMRAYDALIAPYRRMWV